MILVICTGNIFRSPLVTAYLKILLKKANFNNVDVQSAGLYAQPGNKAADIALKIAREEGLNLTAHTSSPLSPELLSNSKIILVMEKFHKSFIENICPDAEGKVQLLGSYYKMKKSDDDIADPFGSDYATCKKAWERMKKACENFVDTSLDLHMLYGQDL
jgi:protein arginine phosphatase